MPYEISHDPHPPEPRRPVLASMLRGASSKCPACGGGNLFSRFLKSEESCTACGEELHHHRADDAPAYFTMFIVGHIVVAGVLAVEDAYMPPMYVHALLWGPLTILLSLALLPRIKGALIGLQWANRMHGFDKSAPADDAAAPDRL